IASWLAHRVIPRWSRHDPSPVVGRGPARDRARRARRGGAQVARRSAATEHPALSRTLGRRRSAAVVTSETLLRASVHAYTSQCVKLCCCRKQGLSASSQEELIGRKVPGSATQANATWNVADRRSVLGLASPPTSRSQGSRRYSNETTVRRRSTCTAMVSL